MINIGPMELIIVLGLALLVFGPKRLPEVGRAVGAGIRELRSTAVAVDPRPDLRATVEAADVRKDLRFDEPPAA